MVVSGGKQISPLARRQRQVPVVVRRHYAGAMKGLSTGKAGQKSPEGR